MTSPRWMAVSVALPVVLVVVPLLACGFSASPGSGPPAEGLWEGDQIDPQLRAQALEVTESFWSALQAEDYDSALSAFAMADVMAVDSLKSFGGIVGDAKHDGTYLSEVYLVREPLDEPLLLTGRTRSHQVSHFVDVNVREVFVALKPFPYRNGERLGRTILVRVNGEWKIEFVQFGPLSYGGLEPPEQYAHARQALDEERWLDAFFYAQTGRCIEEGGLVRYPNTQDAHEIDRLTAEKLGNEQVFRLDEVPTRPTPYLVSVEVGRDRCETLLTYWTDLKPGQTAEIEEEAQQVLQAMSKRSPGFAAAPAQVLLRPVDRETDSREGYPEIALER